jgi:hypothetical protein
MGLYSLKEVSNLGLRGQYVFALRDGEEIAKMKPYGQGTMMALVGEVEGLDFEP